MGAEIQLAPASRPALDRATMPALIRQAARDFGASTLMLTPGATLSFAELDERSALLARGLLASGIGKGSRVGILMANSPDWIVTFMAVTRIGAFAVPMSSLYQPPELKWVCRHADLHCLFMQDNYRHHDYVARLEAACPDISRQDCGALRLRELPFLRNVFIWAEQEPGWARSVRSLFDLGRSIEQELLDAAEDQVVPADLLCMIYTSGSTADPKGVMHAHGKVLRHTAHMAHNYWSFGKGDLFLSSRPFFWVGGLMVPILYSMHAGSTICQPEQDDPDTVVELIRKHGLTGAYHSAAWAKGLAAHPAFRDGDLRTVRLASDSLGFAARDAEGGYRFIGSSLQSRFGDMVTGHPPAAIPNSLGMTETICTHSSLPPEIPVPDDKKGSCGLPIQGVELRIVDPVTRRDVPRGEAGELLVGGATVAEGYYKRERSDTFEAGGWLPTGDLCRQDSDDYVYIEGRLVDTLKVNGANVSPLEVERCIAAIPGVAECAVIGLNRDAKDCVLAAVICPLEGEVLDSHAVLDALRGQLSSFKLPKQIVFIPSADVPRTGSGKIQKQALPALIESMTAGRLRA